MLFPLLFFLVVWAIGGLFFFGFVGPLVEKHWQLLYLVGFISGPLVWCGAWSWR